MAILILNYELARDAGQESIEIDAPTLGTFLDEAIGLFGRPLQDVLESHVITINGRSPRLLGVRRLKLKPTDKIWLVDMHRPRSASAER